MLKRKRDDEDEVTRTEGVSEEAEYKRVRSQYTSSYLQQASVWAGKWAQGQVKQEKTAGQQEQGSTALPYPASFPEALTSFPGYEAAMGQYSSASPTQGGHRLMLRNDDHS